MEIKATLSRFEGKLAVLKTADSTEIIWPIKSLPSEMEIGSQATLSISAGEMKEKSVLAKEMLNEILNVQNNH